MKRYFLLFAILLLVLSSVEGHNFVPSALQQGQGQAARSASVPVTVASDQIQCTSVAAINQTAGTTVITGVASQRIYVCAIMVISATAQSISFVEGTGTVCATGIAALIGGTTASVALAANGGFSVAAPFPWMYTQVNANNLCLLQSGAGNVSGIVSYRTAAP